MDHCKLAELAVERAKKIESISKIVLYGSVLNGGYTSENDIDLAFILDDFSRGLPLDLEGIPLGLPQDVNRRLVPLDGRFHIVFYYASDYENGIILHDGQGRKPSLLHEIGKVIYDSELPI
ncbi:MAG: nucleotidyltransferase domain-containing protein [Nanoarchaeota archaeon]|nr:nucleotidyltransferase domain-containing protein [Nanoarchaeota archaeon]